MRLKIYSDGASRGNPGFSAIAFIILSEDEKVVRRYSKYLGIRTNNQAEYEALISALISALELGGREVTCHVDSQLVVKQLNGDYRVRSPELKTLWLQVRELEKKFHKVTFTFVPRTDNHIREVDWLANSTLNTISRRL